MSRTNDKSGGSHSGVSPPPSLAANGARHRSNGNYVKSYGRSSFEQQQLEQKAKQALQPSTQETLRRVNSKPSVRGMHHHSNNNQSNNSSSNGGGANTRPVRSPVTSDPSHVTVSEASEDHEDSDGVELSPLTTPAQSYLPEHRRRGGQAAHGPTAAATRAEEKLSADKENTNVPVRAANSRTAAPTSGDPSPPPPAATAAAAVVVAHTRPAFKSAPSASGGASGTPAVLYRRTPSSNGRAGNGGGHHGSSGAAAAASAVSGNGAGQRGVVPKRTTSLKARPAIAGPRKAAAVAASSAAPSSVAAGTPGDTHTPQRNHRNLRDGEAFENSPPSPLPIATTAAAAAASRESDRVANENEVAQVRVVSRSAPSTPPPKEVDWALQSQLDQATSVLTYVAEVTHALAERRRCAAPPASTENFRASVVPCRRVNARHRDVNRRNEEDVADDDEEREERRTGVEADLCRGGDGVALLPDLHRAASALLSAFTRLEYAQLSTDVDVPLLEREALERNAQLGRLVDGIDRQLALHERLEVRRLRSEHRAVFVDAHRLADFVARLTQQVVLLRGLAAQHELVEAQDALERFKQSVTTQQQQQQQSSRGEGCAGEHTAPHAPPPQQQSTFSSVEMLRASPFFDWLESRWFPAMRAWRQLVLDTRQAASGGDTDGAIRRSRQDALQIAGLHEILRHGESVADLHHAQIVVPLTELAKTFAQKRAVMEALRGILADREHMRGGSAALGKVLKAAQAYTNVRSGRLSAGESGSNNACNSASDRSVVDSDDAELVKEAEDFFHRLVEVERLRAAVAALLQTPSPELTALLEHLTHANELILLWRLPHNEAAARTALTAGRRALEHVRLLLLPPPTPFSSSSRSPHVAPPSGGRTSNDSASLHGGDVAGCEVPPLNFTTLPTNASQNSGDKSRHSPLPPPQSPPPPPSQYATSAAAWIEDGFPAGFDVHTLHVPHVSAPAWPSDFDLLYREMCDVFAMLFLRRQAQRQLEQALGGHAADDRPQTRVSSNTSHHYNVNGTPSPQATPRRPTRMTDSVGEEQRLSEDGSATLCTDTARSSEDADSTRRGYAPFAQSPPAPASAEELRRRIQQAEEAGISGGLVEVARARLRRLLTVRLKVHFDAQTRVLPVVDATEANFADVYAQLHAHCQTQLAQSSSPSASAAANNNNNAGGTASSPWADRRLRIRYEDADGDFISLLNQQDWNVMLSELLQQDDGKYPNNSNGRAGAKIDLFCDYPFLLNVSPPPQQQENSGGNAGQDSVCGTDFQTSNGEGEDAAAAAAAAQVTAPAPTCTATPEKQPNVFDRLTSAKETTPNAHGSRGVGGNVTRTPRGRGRGAAGAGALNAHPNSSSGGGPHALIPRTRAALGGAARKGVQDSPSSSTPGKKAAAAAAASQNSPAELTADNLRRNIFLTSPSPPSTEGRRSGASGSGGREKDPHNPEREAKRSPGDGGPSAKANIGPLGHAKKPTKKRSSPATEESAEGDPPSTAAAEDMRTPDRQKLHGGSGHHNIGDNKSSARAVAEGNLFSSDVPSSAVQLDIDGARRWEVASEDELQLLEIQTRASVSTVRVDHPCMSSSSFEAAPRSRGATAGPTSQLSPSVGRNTFTTSHCSGKTATLATNNNEATNSKNSNVQASSSPASAAAATQNTRDAPSNDDTTAAHPSSSVAPAALPSSPASAEVKKPQRATQSPPRHAPRRWTADEFDLDEVATVCSDRSRAAMLPVVPRGPTSLPPRPQTPSGTPNRTPQRGRRGARGTPTRGSRPETTEGVEGADAVAGGAAGTSDSAEDVFAEMQRMREENTRAMAQPRKAAWH